MTVWFGLRLWEVGGGRTGSVSAGETVADNCKCGCGNYGFSEALHKGEGDTGDVGICSFTTVGGLWLVEWHEATSRWIGSIIYELFVQPIRNGTFEDVWA